VSRLHLIHKEIKIQERSCWSTKVYKNRKGSHT